LGVIPTVAVLQAEGGISHANGQCVWEIPHPAELRRIRDDASKSGGRNPNSAPLRKPLSSLTMRTDPPSIAGQTRKFAATVKMCVRQPKRDSQ